MMAVDMAQGQGIPAVQPYNIILTGSFGVGKTSLFSKLSGEAHEDYQFVSVPVATSAQHVSKWTHTAAVNGDTVKVNKLVSLVVIISISEYLGYFMGHWQLGTYRIKECNSILFSACCGCGSGV